MSIVVFSDTLFTLKDHASGFILFCLIYYNHTYLTSLLNILRIMLF